MITILRVFVFVAVIWFVMGLVAPSVPPEEGNGGIPPSALVIPVATPEPAHPAAPESVSPPASAEPVPPQSATPPSTDSKSSPQAGSGQAAPQPAPAPLPTPIAPTAPPPPPAGSLTQAEIYAMRSTAVVQIFCQGGGKVFAATGVIVNARGLVLTNAHVVQFVRDIGPSDCQARHGNPASAFAGVDTVFMPDTGPKIPDTDVPQRDFGFLILKDVREPFAVAPIATEAAAAGASLYTLGYPSEFLQGLAAFNNANLVFSILAVHGLANVDDDEQAPDVYVFQGGIALQQGSSGTALLDQRGSVVGIIFATTQAGTTGEREGVGLITSYMDRVLRTETGQGLLEFIATH
ncbi:hypothetical protein C4552_00345 [Candidatus Parcubacteria bacterium]|nr:MAG: hypothetical protein C4552_00345 [Candidatus Parcubacteria bacterium]